LDDDEAMAEKIISIIKNVNWKEACTNGLRFQTI
jgi:hypothetical protein